jgi:hypothetical protein
VRGDPFSVRSGVQRPVGVMRLAVALEEKEPEVVVGERVAGESSLL